MLSTELCREADKKGLALHLPVLLKEVIPYLNLKSGDLVVDGTLGGGGHAKEILKAISPGGKLIAIEKDPETIQRTRNELKELDSKITYINDDFRNIEKILEENKIASVDGAIFDLGISSFQIDEGDRGFSFLNNGPLDMRFNAKQELSAWEVVNKFSKTELADIIYRYGEERHSRFVAKAITDARRKKSIDTTEELTEVIEKSIGKRYARQRLHPAARTFQALRIYVNDELNSIEEAINSIIVYLRPGAKICVISFHSLEDRIIKHIFRQRAKDGDIKIITKKPICPTAEEIQGNSRSRSAKLRVAERII